MYGRGVGGIGVTGGTITGTLATTGVPIAVTVMFALVLVSLGFLMLRRGRARRPL